MYRRFGFKQLTPRDDTRIPMCADTSQVLKLTRDALSGKVQEPIKFQISDAVRKVCELNNAIALHNGKEGRPSTETPDFVVGLGDIGSSGFELTLRGRNNSRFTTTVANVHEVQYISASANPGGFPYLELMHLIEPGFPFAAMSPGHGLYLRDGIFLTVLAPNQADLALKFLKEFEAKGDSCTNHSLELTKSENGPNKIDIGFRKGDPSEYHWQVPLLEVFPTSNGQLVVTGMTMLEIEGSTLGCGLPHSSPDRYSKVTIDLSKGRLFFEQRR